MKNWYHKQLAKYYLRKWYRYNVRTEEYRLKSLKYWDMLH